MSEPEPLHADLFGPDEGQAEATAARLAQLGDRALDVLAPLLSNPQPDQRWWAVRALAGIPTPAATSLLVAALGDPEPSVQHCAALGLAGRQDADAITALVSALSSPDSLLARLAANGLVGTGPPAVPALLQAYAENDPGQKMEVVRALALIGDPQSIPALFAAQEDDSYLVEYWAGEGLERMGVGTVYFKP